MSGTYPSHGVMLPAACRCAEVLGERDFRDTDSFNEYTTSGVCQYCQDLAWFGFTVGHDGLLDQQFFLRRGVVLAHSQEHAQSALVPFVFGAPGRPVGWDLSEIILVGQSQAGVDPAAALTSLREYTLTHRLGVVVVDTPSDPLLDPLRGCAVVVGFQRDVLEQFVDACPALREGAPAPARHQFEVFADDDSQRKVDLVDLIVACQMDCGYDRAAGPPDALRQCAWTVCALHIPDGDQMLLDGVLAPHRRLVGPAPRACMPAPLH